MQHSSNRTPALTFDQRVVTLDLLRGYFLFVMIIDHLGRFPGLFDLVTGRDRMWVSAAEGFFFISGMVTAIARNRDAAKRGLRAAAMNMWKRAGVLYLWAVGLTLFFTSVAFTVGEHRPGLKAGVIGREAYGHILYRAATFEYVYGWTDFLPYYVMFLLAAPLALWLLRRDWWWAVAAASAGVWLSSSRFECRWQVLFFGGMIAGFYLPALERWFHRSQRGVQRIVVATVIGLAGVTVVVNAGLLYLEPRVAALGWREAAILGQWNVWLAPHFDKGLLPLPRLLMFALWFAAIYLIFRRYETVIGRYLGWFFLPLGLNSLFAYIAHGLVVTGIALALPQPTSLATNFAIGAGVLLLIWGATVMSAGWRSPLRS